MIQHNSQLADFLKQTYKWPVSHRQTIVYETKLQVAKADRLIAKYSVKTFPSSYFGLKSVDLSIFRWTQILEALR